MNQPGEPSVEDILESIKLVIARDAAPSTRPLRPVPAPAMQDRRPRHRDDEDVLDLAEADSLAEGDAPRGPADNKESAMADTDAAPLINAAASTTMRESLATLAMLAEPGARPRIVRSGETSLEDLARDLLRPALAEWLDAHLPAMVERMVAAEIARIVGKKA
jgi:cell pole-organizing protein PopZ